MDPDSDGDGYWDGWIGVYDVGVTDNVVLYMEHLETGDGIEGDEIVQEQTGVHKVREKSWSPDREDRVPSARGAGINGDDWLYHSNVHLGELHWGINPADKTDAAYEQTTLQVEVDYYEDANKTALNVLPRVTKNYKLYGMNVEFTVDEELTQSDLDCSLCVLPDHALPPTSFAEARDIEQEYHDDDSKLYMFVTTEGDSNPEPIMQDWEGVEGTASSQGTDGILFGHPQGLGFGVTIFTDDHTYGPSPTHLQKTTVHEIGHILGAGRADDERELVVFPNEIYSGDNDDSTPERVRLSGNARQEWSVMSEGWNSPVNEKPMAGRYIAFSIEELSTIEFNKLDTVDD
jgi:hypothetical protein